jgi:hypothetical protein
MDKKTIELADLFRVGFADYISNNAPLSLEHYKVANVLNPTQKPKF